MFGFIGDLVDTVVDFVTGGGGEDPEPDPCDVGDCLAAQADLSSARGGVQTACLHVRLHLWLVRTAVTLVSLPLWTYFIILLIAFIVGGIAGIVIAVAIYLMLLAFIRVWAPVLAATIEGLAAAYQAEGEAIARVASECPEGCQGDLTLSECDLGEGGTNVAGTAVTNWLGVDFSGR